MTRSTSVTLRAAVIVLAAVAAVLPIPAGAGPGPTPLVVNSNTDTTDGTCNLANCTLREAIAAANASAPSADEIDFAIGSGTPTIAITSALPTITDEVTIEGATGGATRIELNGTAAGTGVNGLEIATGPVTVRHLVVNRFPGDGIRITAGAGAVVTGSYIGTDAAGMADLGNGEDGIDIAGASDAAIGGVDLGNVISGNAAAGIRVQAAAANNDVAGNAIGWNASRTATIPNDGAGVLVQGDSTGTSIGGTSEGLGNDISGNEESGIVIGGAGSVRNSIRRNSITGNTGPGIDLGSDGPTANDAGDTDTGPNDLQNWPDLTSASTVFSGIRVSGTLDSTPSSTYRLEVFANPSCDGTAGEGKSLLGARQIVTDNTGAVTFETTFGVGTVQGTAITATVTDPLGSTSEFSECETLTDGKAPTSTIVRPVNNGEYQRDSLKVFRGNASDELSGVTRVQVALKKTLTSGACKWWNGTGFVSGDCDPNVGAFWRLTTGTTTWSYTLSKLLGRSEGNKTRSYTAYSRAKDVAGNLESVFQTPRNRNTFEIV